MPIPDQLLGSEAAFASPEEMVPIVARILSASIPGSEVQVGLVAGGDAPIVYGYVTGAGDDAVAGEEFRYVLQQEASGWSVRRIEQRTHCRRGADARGVCV